MAAVLAAVGACDGTPASSAAGHRTVELHVVDEQGRPVPLAQLELVAPARTVDVKGTAEVRIDQPVAGVLTASGFLSEPVVLDPTQRSLTVELIASVSPTGIVRRAFHFGGDVMMGRRYQQPSPGATTPVVTTDDDARELVSSVAPLMRAADASMVNLETVVGELPDGRAYPGKRYLLQSPPSVLAALGEMGIDLVTLGNNHARDWLDEGIASTIGHLDDAGIAWAGAGTGAGQAEAGRLIEVRGAKVGVVSATTVNGDFVNDNLPTSAEELPADLPADQRWQYAERRFYYGEEGDPVHVEPTHLRAGDAWSLFTKAEPTIAADEAASLWAAIVAVFPELQDWVARRGHGGAAQFRSDVVAGQIAALRAEGAALVIVQIHGGFQFSDVPSDFLRRSARAAIDAGADLVVGHHPHVLQGFEWYKGHLIAYSLGNFLFDQDYLATFPSVMLRTVFAGDQLLEARVLPLAVDGYRPVPLTGEAGRRTLRLMNTSSLLAADSDRVRPDLVTSVANPDGTPTASLQADGSGARVVHAVDATATSITLEPGEVTALPACSVVSVSDAPDDTELGYDVLGWGTLDDVAADGRNRGGSMWVLDGASLRHSADRGTFAHLEATAHLRADARQVARSAVPVHRLYGHGVTPLDGDPRYTLQLRLRRSGKVPRVKVSLYDVNDMDPTAEPTSTLLHEADIDLPSTPDGAWRTVSLDLSDVINAEYLGVRAEALFVTVIDPPGDNRLDVDDVRLFEWRAAELDPARWVAADAVRSVTGGTVLMQVSGCPTG